MRIGNCSIVKAVAHIYMTVSDEVLGNIKGLTSSHDEWSKLKTMYKSTTAVNQACMMRRLIAAWLEDAKFSSEHISTFNDLLNQLQDVGLQIFDDKMKAIFLLMTLPETREALVVHSQIVQALHLMDSEEQSSSKKFIEKQVGNLLVLPT